MFSHGRPRRLALSPTPLPASSNVRALHEVRLLYFRPLRSIRITGVGDQSGKVIVFTIAATMLSEQYHDPYDDQGEESFFARETKHEEEELVQKYEIPNSFHVAIKSLDKVGDFKTRLCGFEQRRREGDSSGLRFTSLRNCAGLRRRLASQRNGTRVGDQG